MIGRSLEDKKNSRRSALRGQVAPLSTVRTNLKRLRTRRIAHQRIGKILKRSRSAVEEGSPHHEHINLRLFLCGFRDHNRRITAQKYAGILQRETLRLKKSSSLWERKTPVFAREIGSRPLRRARTPLWLLRSQT